MPATLSRRPSRRTGKASKLAAKPFWVRPANAELDRAGDWLLRNLSKVRAEAVSRAPAR